MLKLPSGVRGHSQLLQSAAGGSLAFYMDLMVVGRAGFHGLGYTAVSIGLTIGVGYLLYSFENGTRYRFIGHRRYGYLWWQRDCCSGECHQCQTTSDHGVSSNGILT